ncbi:hypothetical protein NLI96_g1200 [Meripilus lineatus]|uniref:Uncharacterized protein n=1 Tax=Meripilus lineatus TaxID=2056292 RepID=A0AAD5YLB0_9APHY|nr:hypothetical protein NLI96_g1200 [Physisporinus lineatus]
MVVASTPSSLPFSGEENSVFDTLSKTLSFNEDQRFWWETAGYPLAKMYTYAGYSVNAQYLHLLFFYVRSIAFLGPRPKDNRPVFKSYMTDDHSPFETSWTKNADNKFVVRYGIEPFSMGQVRSGEATVAQMISGLLPTIDSTFNTSWFEVLKNVFAGPFPVDLQLEEKARHPARFFIAFDCLHNGETATKVYFMTETPSICTGIPREELVMSALSQLNVGLDVVWQDILRYFDTLPIAVRPVVEMIATDCAAPQDNRIKVYVRTRSTCFADLEGLITLGGASRSLVIDGAVTLLAEMWRDIMGSDTSVEGWKERPLPYIPGVDETHLTGGLTFNYELKPGSTKPGFKVYLPVRFHCPDDYTIACRSRKFYNLGNTTPEEYASTLQSIFSPHREIGARTGIQTYVGVSLKKSGCEVYVDKKEVLRIKPERGGRPL